MSLRVDQDHARFKQIIRGKIRQNLRKFISKGELLGKQGKEVVSIPIPQIDIPRFRFTDKQGGGVSQGDGDAGDPMGPARSSLGKAKLAAVKVSTCSRSTSASPIWPRSSAKSWRCPTSRTRARAGSRARKTATSVCARSDRTRCGTSGARIAKRCVARSAGTYDGKRPVIIPVRDDLRYRSFKTEVEPIANAVILYMMDVSGSMGDEQKEIVRIESFWIDTWLRHQYQGLETRFIIHDAVAREVDRDTFFKTRESGGTMISSAYKLASEIIEQSYPPGEWNIYLFHFSDGDNWSVDDTLMCVSLMKDKLLPAANAFCYGQVESPYGSGQFIKDLDEHFKGDERVLTSEIKDRDSIVDSIKEFLGKGK